MNALCYKVIFSKRLGALVAVGENATSQGKSASGAACRTVVAPTAISKSSTYSNYVGALKSLFVASTLACVTASPSWAAPDANALPTNGVVQTGAATVSTNGTAMTINQATQKASINWNSFSIGKDASVNVVQNNASSVLLNRVVGNDPSHIFGKLTANGQVILINPNGVVFGKGGSVTASAFTASTFGMSDADFQNGKYKYTRNGSTAGVTVENGADIHTTTPGGYVALIGASVNNQGEIHTQQGAVVMASGESVALPTALTDSVGVPLSSKVRLELAPSTLNASVENGGTITTEGGQVLMQASAVVDAVSHVANASVTHAGTIDTTGEQGGRVDVLADHGTVRVSGIIKANSTDGSMGGKVFIGRDEVTNVLAAIGDASGARIESKGGFVETSGEYLKTTGTRVLAKDWLLDPTDINIVSSDTSTANTPKTPDTPPVTGATQTYQQTGSINTSEVLKADIEASINNGTNVIIETSNGPGSGEGNITIKTKLDFDNDKQDATLSLKARNGIIQEAGASITNTGEKRVHIAMEALGLWAGQSIDHVSSQGITLNSTVTTNGTVTLTGTSRNTSGVQISSATNNSRSGVVFNAGSGITADNFQITGTHHVAAGNSFGVNGVYMSGAVNLVATGNTNSTITGISNAQGNFGAGVMVWDGATVRLGNQGTGVTTIRGSNTHAGGGNGVRIGASENSAVINAVGRVTIGQQTAGVNAPIFIRGTLNASLNTSNLGGLTILGQTGSGLTTTAVQLWDTNINAAGVDLVIDGIAGNATGVYIQTALNTTWTTKNLTVTGVANTTSGSSGSGVVIQRYPNVLTVNASGNISVTGTVQGAGNGSGIDLRESGWGPQSITMNAAETITLRGNNRASTGNPSQAIYIGAGLQARAVGNITVQAETNNSNVNAISFFSQATTTNGGLNGNVSLRSIDANGNATGDVLIQSNRGGITFNNQLPSTSSATTIVGRNIIIDNTGGTVDANTGAITAGAGRSESGVGGINLADARSLTASGNINILGVTNATNQWGVMLSGPLNANTMNVVGRHTNGAAGGGGMFIRSGTNLTTRSGDSVVQGVMPSVWASNAMVLGDSGTSTVTLNATNGSRLKLQGDATGAASLGSGQNSTGIVAQGTLNTTGNIELVGSSGTTNGLNLNATVNHSGGALTLSGTSSPNGIASGFWSSGVLIQRAVTITDNSALAITGSYVGRGSVSTNTTLNGVIIDANVTGGGGALNITGTSSLPSAIATNARGVAINRAVSGWGNTTVTGQAAGSSTGHSIILAHNVNIGANQLQLLANGGQVHQSSASTITAGAVVIDNTGAGRSSLFADNSVTPNLANGASFGGSIAADGAIVAGNAVARNSSGIDLRGTINASGDVNIAGSTASTTAANAGVYSSANINGRDITMVANATSNTGPILGYYGAAGRFIASQQLNLTGTSSNAGNGLYSYGGRYEAGTGMTLVGTSALGNAMGMDAKLEVVNGSSGGINITATAKDSSKNALAMRGVSMTNGGGDMTINAISGHITADTGTPVWNLGTLSNTLTQNGSGDVRVTTVGNGNITVPKIVNAGSGNVIVAAGHDLAAGNADGGQILTVLGNTITNASGRTYIYTGKAALTGKLSHLDNTLATLSLSSDTGTSSTPVKQNADSNVMYPTGNNTLGMQNSTATAQVMFREKLAFDIDLTNTILTKTYGETGTSNSSIVQLAKDTLASNNTGNFSRTSNAGDIQISKAALIDSLNVKVKDAKYSTSSFLSAGTYTLEEVGGLTPLSNKYDVKINNGNATVAIDQKPLTVSYTADNKVFDGTTAATVTSTMAGLVAGDQVALKHAAANFSDADVANGKTVTVTGIQLNSNNANNDAANYKVVTNASPTTGTSNAVANATTATTTANITAVPPKPPVPVVPTDGNSSRVKVPVGSANPFALASAEDLADDTCSANSIENCHCEASPLNANVDICYEPKDGAKGSAR